MGLRVGHALSEMPQLLICDKELNISVFGITLGSWGFHIRENVPYFAYKLDEVVAGTLPVEWGLIDYGPTA